MSCRAPEQPVTPRAPGQRMRPRASPGAAGQVHRMRPAWLLEMHDCGQLLVGWSCDVL